MHWYRTNNRNRGSSHFTSGSYDERTPSGPTANRGTHPPWVQFILKTKKFHLISIDQKIEITTSISDAHGQHWNHRERSYRRQRNSKIFTNTHQHDQNHCIHNQFQTKPLPSAEKMFVCCLIVTVAEETFQVKGFFQM